MSDDIPFERNFDSPAGTMETVSPLVRRMVAGNRGPFTFTGTCTYVVGRGDVAVIDPGPEDSGHIARLLAALQGEHIGRIVVTHTHRDHSPGARLLRAATGAPIVGCGPHRPARPLHAHETGGGEGGGDRDHVPDTELADGERIEGDGWTLEAVATPGHTANHLAFALPEENALFSGDHVMAWSTTVVAPPDGAMGDYMASLARLGARPEEVYWPGHGGPVTNPQRYVRALAHHRRQREASILDRLAAGDTRVAEIVPRLYEGLAPALLGGAAMSVLAHIEDLVARGVVESDGPPSLGSRFELR
ncbi:MBL fold metallo-hydrolase [Alsobacter sp. SYSU M60028]|uniref:MBL fold metallo-hydrolase n=1 Tax=Alsobacter ponti TaxID=2962936 RepID=A0ABT1LDV2_9HYPH|nr:MBL fold metallo-hydrolase [Alsobacter ponti]MCP8939283.1 MBL fold metallo-hydrolase [Alsobacter ponti]